MIIEKLQKLGLELPAVAAPAAAYVPYTVHNDIITISGQLPFSGGALLHTGHLGDTVTVEQGQEAAKACALNILALISDAVGGDASKIKQVLKLEILVAAKPEFTEAHVVANGASNLFLEILGDKGKHARAAYGVAVLPLNAAVEVTAMVALH